MNMTQIRYFLEAARCLNFTEAAKQLYITQPALSQQITAIETELNMQLFVRDRNRLRLTPAALVLLEHLPEHMKQYTEIIEIARIANGGNTGNIRIGILQGQVLTERFHRGIRDFRAKYPQIHLQYKAYSFAELRHKLDTGELDLIYTTDFDVSGNTAYHTVRLDANIGVAVVSRWHSLAEKKVESLSQLCDETIIIIGEDDSEMVKKMILSDCRTAGFIPNLLLADSINEQMLWIESGLGVGIINTNSYICQNPNVKILDELVIGSNYFVLARHRDSTNAAAALLTDLFRTTV